MPSVLRLSIIVPHISDDVALETTLLSILENRPAGIEVIVVHSGNYRDPYDLDREEIRLVRARGSTSLVHLINDGLACVLSPVLQVVLPGAVVTSDWTNAAVAWFHDTSIGCVSPLVSQPDKSMSSVSGLDSHCLPRRAMRRGVRRGEEVIGTLCGGYYRTEAIRALNGWLTTSREAAEVEMGLALNALQYRCLHEPSSELVAPKAICEGDIGGYPIGHFAAQLAVAYSRCRGIDLVQDSLAARIGHLAGGLIQPWSVAERIGWVLGLSDTSLVETIRHRLAEATAALASSKRASSSSRTLRRAA